MKKILLDANFLLIPGQFKVDIFEGIKNLMNQEYKLYTIDMVIDELNNLTTKGTGRDKRAAKLGLSLLSAKTVEVLKTEKHLNTDKMIVETAKDSDFIVATQDQALKRLLKQNKTSIIVLKRKKYLEFD
jgi:rRNA-processing protein FCF1